MGCIADIALVVWFLCWMGDKTPYLLHAWNPWNVSLVIIAALVTAGGAKYVSKDVK